MVYSVPAQVGRLAVVTGANSGTGKEAARGLAAAGAEVILAVRNPERGERARQDILAGFPSAKVTVRRLDLADLSSVEAFAHSLRMDGRPIDLLLNNAGVMMLPKRYETADGLEMQFGTNFVGPFAFTLRLLPLLLQADGPRIVTMSSGNQAAIDLDDLNSEKRYDPNRAYGRSKLADLLFAQELARIATRRGWDLLSLGAHPGNASTDIYENGKQYGDKPILPLRIAWQITPSHSAAAGAAPLLHAATHPKVVQGGYYGPRFGLIGGPTSAAISRRARDEVAAARLWAEAERITGVSIDHVVR